jgi:hypothetical protein
MEYPTLRLPQQTLWKETKIDAKIVILLCVLSFGVRVEKGMSISKTSELILLTVIVN